MKHFDGNNLLLGIDPGSQTHGVVVYNTHFNDIEFTADSLSLKEVMELSGKFNAVIIEDYDQVHGAVGHSVLDTVRNIGRLDHHFKQMGYIVHLIGRGDIKSYLKAKDDVGVIKKMKELYPNIKIKGKHWVQAFAAIHRYQST